VQRTAQLVVACSIWGATVAAAAQSEPDVEVSVALPEHALDCVSGEVIRTRIAERGAEEHLLGRIAVALSGAEERDGRWRLGIDLSFGGVPVGSREIVVAEDDCASVAEAVALTVVLVLRGPEAQPASPSPWTSDSRDSALDREPRDSGRAPPSPRATVTAAEPRSSPGPDQNPTSRTHVRAELGLEALLGPLPSLVPAMSLQVHMTLGTVWYAELDLLAALPPTTALQEGELELIHAALRGAVCVALTGDAWGSGLDACPVVSAGVVRGAGRDFEVWTGSQLLPAVGVGGQVRGRLDLGEVLYVSASVVGEAQLVRPVFEVNDRSGAVMEAYGARSWAAGARIALGARLF